MKFVRRKDLFNSKIYKGFLKTFVCSFLLIFSGAASASSPSVGLKNPNTKNRPPDVSHSVPLVQRPPSEDFLIPGTDLPSPLPAEPSPIEAEVGPDSPTPSEMPTAETIEVSRIEVINNTVIPEEDIAAIVAPLEGTAVTVATLAQVADDITALYVSRGYLTTQAVLVEQEIVDGVVTIEVQPGSLSDIRVEGLSHLRSDYVSARLARGDSTPLNINRVEEQLRLLSLNPLLEDIRGRLEPGDEEGTSILSVEAIEADPWDFGVSIDNYSPPSVGSERLGAVVAHNNLSGWGDRLAVRYYRTTTGGSNNWDFSYQVPVNAMDGTLSLQANFDEYEVTEGDFAGEIEGSTERYAVSFRQPIILSLREELALSAGFSYRSGQTFLGNESVGFGIGPDPDTGISRTSVFKFGQDYTLRDESGAWALRSQFNLGTGLFDATINAGAVPDSQFFSWLGQVQRVQQLGPDNLLIIQADLQLTPDSLLPSEQFVIGGGQSLRGYRQNARSGDNGFRVSIEDRITLVRDDDTGNPVLQLAPFVDAGSVWNHPDNPNRLENETFLVGTGLGLLYEPFDGLNLRLDYGLPLVSFSGEGDNIQDNGLYFSVNYLY